MQPKRILKVLCICILGITCICFTLHLILLDGIDGWLFSLFFKEDTVYASGYSAKAFRKIKNGMSEQDVLNVLGKPLGDAWFYENSSTDRIIIDFDAHDTVSYMQKAPIHIQKGMTKEQVFDVLGTPNQKSWGYSESPGNTHFRIRTIVFRNNEVVKKYHEFYVD